MKNRKWIGLAAAAGLFAVAAGVLVWSGDRTHPGALAAETTSLPLTSSTSASPSTSTTSAPPLPVPEDAPADARADVPVIQVGEIEIPKIGLRHPIYEGVWLTVLDVGPGHWPGTAEPGGYGNSVIAGHRVTHSHPFRRIDELGAGDHIIVRTPKGVFTYTYEKSLVVEPSETWIAVQEPGHTLTLFACHPPGSARYRYVVRATLVQSEPPVPVSGMASA